MKSISLLTLYQPQPCVEGAEGYIRIQHVKCDEEKHLTMTLGNANFTDLWFYMVESSKELDGKYVSQQVSLFSDEDSENILDEEWKRQDKKYVLIALIKIDSSLDVTIEGIKINLQKFMEKCDVEGNSKIFRTFDNADLIVMYFSKDKEKLKKMMDKLKNFKYNGYNNIYYSFYSATGRFRVLPKGICDVREISISKDNILKKNKIEEISWCKQTMKVIQERMEECLADKNKKWLSYYQNTYQIINLLEQYEQKEKFKDLFYVFFPAIHMFFVQLDKGQKLLSTSTNHRKYYVMQKLEDAMSEFIDGMELLIHHIGISCSNILNVDGRNGLAYDIPIRLCLLYLAAFYEIKQVLNDTEYQYQFFLTPLAYSRPKTNIFDFCLDPGDRFKFVLLGTNCTVQEHF